MDVNPNSIKLSVSDTYVENNFIKYKKVDICRNIFLAKTDTISNLWDDEMKLCEHELAFLEYKKRGYEVYWTDYLSFKKISTNTSEEYKIYRDRLGNYQKILKQKLNISGWVSYSPEAMKEIKEYKRKYNL